MKITETSQAGAEVILSIEEAGEVVGGLGVMPGGSRTRTAQALERCHMLMSEAGKFQTLFERYPRLPSIRLILSEHLRVLEDRFQDVDQEQQHQRVRELCNQVRVQHRLLPYVAVSRTDSTVPELLHHVQELRVELACLRACPKPLRSAPTRGRIATGQEQEARARRPGFRNL